MSYIGIPPYGQTVRSLSSYTATAGQTTFYPTGGYTVTYLDVYLNGLRQVNGTDYTAADGLSIVFTDPLIVNDIVEIVVYGTISFADSVRRSGDTLTGTYYTQDLIPSANNTYNLGSATARFNDIYLSNSSIFIGDSVVISANATNLIIANTTGGALALSNTSFPNTGVTAGTYGNSSAIPVLTVDSTGRVTSATTNAVAGVTGFTYTTANATFTITTGAGTSYLATIAANSITTAMLTDSGVTAGAYGNTTAIPVITVDAKGRVTAMSTSSVAGVSGVTWTGANNTLTVATSVGNYSANLNSWTNPVTFSNTVAAGNTTVTGYANVSTTLQVTGAATLSNTIAVTGAATFSNTVGVTGAATFSNTVAVTGTSNFTGLITGTITSANNADYLDGQHGSYYSGLSATAYSNAIATAATDASTKAATAYTNAVAYAAANTYVNTTFAPKASPTFTGTAAFADVTVSGNLTTSGTVTYINSTNLNVGDNLITLNADLGAVAPTENAGFEINRGSSANVAFRWNEASDEWQVTTDGTTYAKVATNNDITTAQSYADTKAATAYSNATTYAATVAGTAYSNAITISANATNLTNGTVAPARLPQANTTANGAVIFLDSVANTSTSIYAPTMNAVKTAYDAAITANTRAASAQTAAASAYTNAVAYAASNTYVNTQLGLKASLSGATFSGAVSGITTLAAGNTTITGFANVTSTLQVGGNASISGNTSTLNGSAEQAFLLTVPVNTTRYLKVDITGSYGLYEIFVSGYGSGGSANFAAHWTDGGHGGGGTYHRANLISKNTQGNPVLGDLKKTATGTYLAIQNTDATNVITLHVRTSSYNTSAVPATVTLETVEPTAVQTINYLNVVETTGYVGIGNNAPAHNLSVNGTGYATDSWRAPLFYDSNNTSYYVDPASTSNLNAATFAGAVSGITTLAAGNTTITGNVSTGQQISINGTTQSWSTAPRLLFNTTSTTANNRNWFVGAADTYYGNFHIFPGSAQGAVPDDTSEATTGLTLTYAGNMGLGNLTPVNIAWGTETNTKQLTIYGTNYGVLNLKGDYSTATHYSAGVGGGRYYAAYDNVASVHRLTFYGNYTGFNNVSTPSYNIHLDGTGYATNDWRAPLFYDSNDTSWYLDPAGTSILKSAQFGTTATDYIPSSGGSHTIRLNGANYTSIGFHDSGSTVGNLKFSGSYGFEIGASDGLYGPHNTILHGNVGIANTSPSHKLSVNGNIYAQTPFYENATAITANYTVAANTNAMSAGPITIADGVTVTVSDGSTWTVV